MSLLNLEGAYENELATTGEFNPNAPKTVIVLPSGQRLLLPTEVLLGLPAQPQTASASGSSESAMATPLVAERRPEATAETVIPLLAEQLEVHKAEIETAHVHVRRVTEEHTETVTVPLTEVRWETEHVPIEQRVTAQPEIRRVDDVVIFPIVEERLVVVRELWLREEVHLRQVRTVVEKSADFTVKRDVLQETRSPATTPLGTI